MGLNLKKYFEKHSAFFKGMGSILDIGGGYYRPKPPWMDNDLTPSEQDSLAIKGDWEKVGGDLEKAINKFKKK
jgi:hypothetical protein